MIKDKSFSEPSYEIKANHMNGDEVYNEHDCEHQWTHENAEQDKRKEIHDRVNCKNNQDDVQYKIDKLSDVVLKQQNIINKTMMRHYRSLQDNKNVSSISHSCSFNEYLRKGITDVNMLSQNRNSSKEEGITLSQITEEGINEILETVSPIRSLATKQQIQGSSFNKPAMSVMPKAGWVGEKSPRPQLGANEIVELKFPTAELYAMPMATQSMLDDSAIDIERWLATEVSSVFAEQETYAFISGNGVDMPKGFLSYPQVSLGKGSWGNIEVVETGLTAGFSKENSSDVLLELIYALKPAYRSNAHFLMNRRTLATIRKFKDKQGSYLLQQDSHHHPRLFGHVVIECEEMPDIKADSVAIAFGNFQRGYLITDRLDTRVLRDPFTAKPYVLFYTTKRVGGGVQDFDAIKLLKFS